MKRGMGGFASLVGRSVRLAASRARYPYVLFRAPGSRPGRRNPYILTGLKIPRVRTGGRQPLDGLQAVGVDRRGRGGRVGQGQADQDGGPQEGTEQEAEGEAGAHRRAPGFAASRGGWMDG